MDPPDGTEMATNMTQPGGGSQPVETGPPSVVMSYWIAIEGIYPTRG